MLDSTSGPNHNDSESLNATRVATNVTVGPSLYPPRDLEDLQKVLRNVMKKKEKLEIKSRELGVVFEKLRVVGLGAIASHQPTIASMLNPLNLLRQINYLRHPPLRDILTDFEGVVKPGEMLLVLGRPGAGCSTLLRALANKWDDYHAILGEVHYDSLTPQQIHASYRGDVQYCPEDDVHFPTLTVQETLDFAAKTRVPQQRIIPHRKDHVALMTEVLASVLGLTPVLDTKVGDASIRGISGGEKKRVSIAEVLATRGLLTSWDNSTRGLDASTALEFIQSLRTVTDIWRLTTIVSIYQAGESLYRNFDKVCVIYDGRMVYFGPANCARQYFIEMGYEPANRQTTADFLVAVTNPHGRTVRQGYESHVPRTAAELAAYFTSSDTARANREDIAAYKDMFVGKEERALQFKESTRAQHSKLSPPKSSYIISTPMQAQALMIRRMQIIKGGIATQVIQLSVFIIQAVVVGTMFLRMKPETNTFFSRGGVIFFALLFTALSTMSEIPSLFVQRPIVLRQSRAAMYHPFVEALALTLVDVPVTAVIVTIFSIIFYFLVGLQQTAGHFFTFLLFLLLMTLTMKAWFRLLAAGFKIAAPAQSLAALSILILCLYLGYTLPKPNMIGALRWITYIDPLIYSFEALMVNEFHTLVAECSTIVPSGSTYDEYPMTYRACTTIGSVAGESQVSGYRYVLESFGYQFSHLWRNLGIVFAFLIGFICFLLLLTEINTAASIANSVILFKRGSKTVLKENGSESDEEKAASSASNEPLVSSAQPEKKVVPEGGLHTFSFSDVTYKVPVKGGWRTLLDNVSGYVAPGKLTALIGESGAGKTTLLNALSERTTSGIVTGERAMDGQPLPSDFRNQTGYVQQMDTHLPSATVREALLFSAKLRQPSSVALKEKEKYVEKCLHMCGLAEFADAIVGTLDVEQRKRTTIAVELVAKPSLIFLDEPTTGLDAQSAWAIICFLRSLADSGQSIVCTIHQPSAELFQSFDRLLLLRKGGQTVYFGDIGEKSSTLIGYFQSNGARICDDSENPAEYILEVIGAGATATVEEDWHDIWLKSPEAKERLRELEAVHASGRQQQAVQPKLKYTFPTLWPYQLTMLLERAAVYRWRNPIYMMSKLGVNIAAGLLIGFTFFKAKNGIQDTQDKLFAIFMSTVVSIALSQQLQSPFLAARRVYEIRERHSQMYHWSAMIASELLIEIPWNILGSSLFFLCWFWTVGFLTSRAGFTYLLYAVLYPLYYTSFGQAVAAMSPNAEIAALLFSFLFAYVLLFNGVLQPFRELGWWKWMYRVSPYTYLVEALTGQAVGHTSIVCRDVELTTVQPPSNYTCEQYLGPFVSVVGGYLTNPNATSSCEYCAYSTTDTFLGDNFNIYYSRHWRDLGLFCVYIGFNIGCIFIFMWLFRIHGGSLFHWIKTKIARRT
ncbi:uncharacterized protein LAESUDRAFT_739756 [Laetiporus sulphureus 93-53]|uniref:ABC transporter domain-containing protein n=1 Tax=Laetiporus sulphureus 93-53 TaxID=1314785 RepID=A0A165B1F7_9APHY|nr:uncharacterized protein LAESUDRAFT_739756 [Laetiporus sulphureus 93-53]KZT00050.1 hypothetical protein LAESUDRAFT_739756 [Laetiporus sulphureus 93-53]